MFRQFCETNTLENRECSGRPSKITEKKIDDVIENQQQTSVSTVATTCSVSRTTSH